MGKTGNYPVVFATAALSDTTWGRWGEKLPVATVVTQQCKNTLLQLKVLLYIFTPGTLLRPLT